MSGHAPHLKFCRIRCKRKASSARDAVLLLGAFPVGEKPTDPRRAKMADFNAQIAKLADNKTVFFLDVGKAFIKPDGSLNPIPAAQPYVPAAFNQWADVQRDAIAAMMK